MDSVYSFNCILSRSYELLHYFLSKVVAWRRIFWTKESSGYGPYSSSFRICTHCYYQPGYFLCWAILKSFVQVINRLWRNYRQLYPILFQLAILCNGRSLVLDHGRSGQRIHWSFNFFIGNTKIRAHCKLIRRIGGSQYESCRPQKFANGWNFFGKLIKNVYKI